MELSKIAKTLCAELRDRIQDEDSFIVLMLSLKTEENYTKMLDWIMKNPDSGQEEIYDALDKIIE